MSSFFSWRNWVDAVDAVITPDAEVGQLVAANLKKRQASSAWRTLITVDADDAGFTIDFGKVREIGVLALLFPRDNDPEVFDPVAAIGPADTIRHRLSAVSAGAGELLDTGADPSGVDPAHGYHVVRLAEAVEARWWRCDIAAPSRLTEGFLDVVRAWAGPVFAPAIGFSYGDNRGWAAPADITRARRSPSEYAEAAEATRTWSLSFEGISDDEKESMDDFERYVTAAQQFLMVRNDVAAGRAAMFARQASAGGVGSFAWRRNGKQLRLVESL